MQHRRSVHFLQVTVHQCTVWDYTIQNYFPEIAKTVGVQDARSPSPLPSDLALYPFDIHLSSGSTDTQPHCALFFCSILVPRPDRIAIIHAPGIFLP